jgi:hypothetical protein
MVEELLQQDGKQTCHNASDDVQRPEFTANK